MDPLNLVVDAENYTTLDEAVKALYIEQDDGTFKMNVNVPDANVEGLKAKNDELLGETKKEREKRKELEARIAQIEKEKEKEAEEKAKANGDLESLEKSYQSKLTAAEEKLKQETEALKNQIYELTVGQTATNIANELALKGSADVLLPHIKNRLTLETTDDGEQKIRVLDLQGKKSALTLDDLKQEFRGNTAFKPLIAGSTASGGGANGANSGAGGSDIPARLADCKTQEQKIAWTRKHANK